MFNAIRTVKGKRAADGNTVACISCGFLVLSCGEDHYPFHHNKKLLIT